MLRQTSPYCLASETICSALRSVRMWDCSCGKRVFTSVTADRLTDALASAARMVHWRCTRPASPSGAARNRAYEEGLCAVEFVGSSLEAKVAILGEVGGNLDGNAADGVDHLLKRLKVHEQVMIDGNPEIFLGHHEFIGNPADHQGMIDLGLAVPGQIDAGITWNGEYWQEFETGSRRTSMKASGRTPMSIAAPGRASTPMTRSVIG